jgi:hypothetical protein
MFEPISREARNRIPQAETRAFRPTSRANAWYAAIVEPNIKREADTVWPIAHEPFVDLIRSFNRRTPNHNPTDALPQQVINGG